MSVEVFPIGPLETNCYVYTDDSTGECAIIDPAFYSESLEQSFKERRVKYIFLTHAHIDHIFGAYQIKELTGAEIVLPKLELQRYNDNKINLYDVLNVYYNRQFVKAQVDVIANDGDKFDVGNSVFEVLNTPGHTEGSVCYITEGIMFSGDTIFNGSHGRVDLQGGNMSQIIDSFHKIAQLEGDYIIYPGHMDKTTLIQERETNPLKRFL